jgi:hypothetical protein
VKSVASPSSYRNQDVPNSNCVLQGLSKTRHGSLLFMCYLCTAELGRGPGIPSRRNTLLNRLGQVGAFSAHGTSEHFVSLVFWDAAFIAATSAREPMKHTPYHCRENTGSLCPGLSQHIQLWKCLCVSQTLEVSAGHWNRVRLTHPYSSQCTCIQETLCQRHHMQSLREAKMYQKHPILILQDTPSLL